jgi:hypothetical protein
MENSSRATPAHTNGFAARERDDAWAGKKSPSRRSLSRILSLANSLPDALFTSTSMSFLFIGWNHVPHCHGGEDAERRIVVRFAMPLSAAWAFRSELNKKLAAGH